MIKRVLSVIICLMLVMSLAACGEADPTAIFGKVDGKTYRNDFLGLTCTVPSDWEFYSEEQILQINNMVGEYLDEDVKEQLAKATVVQDMGASCSQDNSSINLNLEKLSLNIDVNIKSVLESQIDALKSSYKNMGYTDIDVNYRTITVDGKTFDSLNLTAKINGVNFYCTIFTFQMSNYLANVTVSSAVTNKTDTLLSYFTID